jgi:hypothetical protein
MIINHKTKTMAVYRIFLWFPLNEFKKSLFLYWAILAMWLACSVKSEDYITSAF